MTTVSEHSYSAQLIDPSGPVALSWAEGTPGEITLDAGAFPHVQGSITLAIEDALLLEDLDPRDSRRVVIDVSADLPGASPARTFDLGIRRTEPDRAAGTVTLALSSDEALVMDYAQLVDDNTPRTLQTSLRAICEYVLSKVPGVVRNLEANSQALPTGSLAAYSARNGWVRTFVVTGSPPLDIPIASVARFTAPAGGTVAFLGVDAYGDLGSAAPGTVGNWVAGPVLTPGQTITVSRWIRLAGTSTPYRVFVRFHDGAGNWVTGNQSGAVTWPAHAGWSRPSWTGVVPLGAKYVSIRTQTANSETVPAGTFMDITGVMTEATHAVRTWREDTLEPGMPDADVTAYWPITNLFTNPSFENTIDGWANGSLATGLAPTTTQKWVGNYSGHWQTSGAGQSFIDFTGPISVQAGRSYVFAQYMRASVARPARVMIRFKNAAGVVLADRYGAAVALSTTDWARVHTIQTAPAGATQATAHVEYQASAAGQFPYVDGLMFYEGNELVPYFDGSTADNATYVYDWTNTAQVSTSTRTPAVERPPESLIWRAGISGMAFLEPMLKAAGLRIVCDEARRWTLRTAEYRADGAQSFRHGVNLESADELLSRDDDAWSGDAAVYEYVWTDKDGIEQRRLDTFSLTPTPSKVLRVEVRDTVYPGPGRAAHMVRRAQGRGRTVTASAIPTWTEQTDQYLSIALEGTPIQTGIAGSVRYDFGADTVAVTSRTVDTAAGAIDLLAGTINALTGTVNNL